MILFFGPEIQPTGNPANTPHLNFFRISQDPLAATLHLNRIAGKMQQISEIRTVNPIL